MNSRPSALHHTNATKNELRIAGLFAGIGGFEVGLGRAGHKASLFCEYDSAAQAVLRSKFPSIENINDVREIDCLPTGIDLISAGFPCQDLSSAGLKKGAEGERSSLVKEVFRILKKSRVEWLSLIHI